MILLTFNRIRQTKRIFAVGILAICIALWFVPVGHGQTDQTSQGPDRANKTLPANGDQVQFQTSPQSAGEATIYVYRGRRPGFGTLQGLDRYAAVFVSGNHYATLDPFTYMQAKVPQGKVFVVGPGSMFIVRGRNVNEEFRSYIFNHGLPLTTGPWASLPECSGLDLRRALFVSGAPVEAQRVDSTPCEGALQRAIARIEPSLTGSAPSKEATWLCGLRYYSAVSHADSRGFYSATAGYSREEVASCKTQMSIALAILKGSFPVSRIAIDVEAGKTYYVKWSYSLAQGSEAGQLELMDTTIGAKDIRKCRPAEDQ
jgi:hypothetical protein